MKYESRTCHWYSEIVWCAFDASRCVKMNSTQRYRVRHVNKMIRIVCIWINDECNANIDDNIFGWITI